MDYRFKSDQMRDNYSEPEKNDHMVAQSFEGSSHVRNLCFVWPDGKRKFYNYAYLVGAEYLPDENIINLLFTSETVSIEGINLLPLYTELAEHHPKQIICIDKRYVQLENDNKPIVFNIVIAANQ